MSEWQEMTLGDVITLQRGFDLTQKQATAGSVQVISSGGPGYTTNVAKVEGPGVVTGRKGVLGKVFFSPGAYWPHDTTLWVKNFRGSDPRFIYYFLQTLPLASLDTGASNPTLNRNHAHLLRVRVPSPSVQVQVARVLGTVDDLIENNRRRVEVLEEMARAIYREWFVHFRFPGHADATFVDSPLGLIPDGWRVKRVAELANVDKGLSYKGAHLTELGTPMANLKCFRPGGGFRRDGTKPYSGPYKPRHEVVSGDLIMANTDLTQAGTVIGSPAFIPRRGFETGGIISHHLFAIRSSEPSRLQWLFESFRDERFRNYARGVASGATVLGFRSTDLLSYRLACPAPAIVEEFAEVRSSLVDLAEDLAEANDCLAALRDLLLPKLVTGQIDVSLLDLDALVDGAVA